MKKLILLIEDDEMLRDMYSLKFKDAGHDIMTADNGDDGLKMISKNNPDIILLDIMMPKMDGFMVMEQMIKDPKLRKIPVIFLTNLKQDEDIEKGKKLGAADYLVKSTLTPAQILDKIEKFLKK